MKELCSTALLALVAIVVISSVNTPTGMLPADYHANFKSSYPTLESTRCPEGFVNVGYKMTENFTARYQEGRIYSREPNCVPSNRVARASPRTHGDIFGSPFTRCQNKTDSFGNTQMVCVGIR